MVRRIVRIAYYTAFFCFGVVVAAVGVFVQAIMVHAGPVPVPIGLVVALGGCAGLFWAGGILLRSRAGVLVPAVAWLLGVLLFASSRPEGDVVLSQAATAYGYLFLGTLLGAASVMLAGVYPDPPGGSLPAPDHRNERRVRSEA